MTGSSGDGGDLEGWKVELFFSNKLTSRSSSGWRAWWADVGWQEGEVGGTPVLKDRLGLEVILL